MSVCVGGGRIRICSSERKAKAEYNWKNRDSPSRKIDVEVSAMIMAMIKPLLRNQGRLQLYWIRFGIIVKVFYLVELMLMLMVMLIRMIL